MIESLPCIDRDVLFERLADVPAGASSDVVVLCVNLRLAQFLQDAYAAWQARRGLAVWVSAAILTPNAFVQRLDDRQRMTALSQADAAPGPLSDAESAFVWRQVVAGTRGEQALLREAEAAQLAAEAWRLCHDYGIGLPLSGAGADVERFNGWAQAYRSRCDRLARSDAALHRRRLIGALDLAAPGLPASVVFAGWSDVPPWLVDLAQALRRSGSELLQLQPRQCDARVEARVTVTAEHELRAAATWVRERAQSDPQARIGVIVPDLQARRVDVQRVFDQALCASLDTVAAAGGERPYNLSLGERLADVGLVRCALSLLRLCVGTLDLAECGSLLCDPYWGDGDADRLARADLDRVLRRDGHLAIDLPLLERAASRSPALQRTLHRLLQQRSLRGTADPGDWCERFSAWLETAGWPGQRALDSGEFQAVEAWRGLLRELGSLGGVAGRIAASGALAQLEQLAQQRVFQPQTPAVNIQVLGALEAEGQDFDALWVMGLDDERWPARSAPSPFIPFELQRRLGMPHASPAQDLAWAERMTACWRRAAPEVVFSWAAQEADRSLAPSPLILREARRAAALSVDALAPAWRAAQRIGTVQPRPDAYGPSPDLSRPVPGGSKLLGDQARCPFRAFATHRLGARPLERPGYGPNPIDRGVLVHRVLDRLWRQLKDQRALLDLDAATLTARIADAVDGEVDRLAHEAPQRFPAAMRRLESERVQALVQTWMALERERAPFTVAELEGSAPQDGQGAAAAEGNVRFGELQLRLRPDRVDRLDDGSLLVIDYKTGARRPLPWHDGRPEEPQLLLYGLTRPGVSGVAYARLRVGATGFDGVAESDAIAPGIDAWNAHRDTRDAASWDALLGRWRGELETLAGEVRRGLAGVTPRHVRQSCRDCHLQAACRIREHVDASAFDDDGEAAA